MKFQAGDNAILKVTLPYKGCGHWEKGDSVMIDCSFVCRKCGNVEYEVTHPRHMAQETFAEEELDEVLPKR